MSHGVADIRRQYFKLYCLQDKSTTAPLHTDRVQEQQPMFGAAGVAGDAKLPSGQQGRCRW